MIQPATIRLRAAGLRRPAALAPRRDCRAPADHDHGRGRRDDRDVVDRRPDFLAGRAGWGPVMILQEDT